MACAVWSARNFMRSRLVWLRSGSIDLVMNCHRFRAEAMRSDVAMKFEHFVVEGVGN